VLAAGGRVTEGRVQGVLNMTRSIGDEGLKPYITAEPSVSVHDIDPGDEWLILASDGLWAHMSNRAVTRVARQLEAVGSSVASGSLESPPRSAGSAHDGRGAMGSAHRESGPASTSSAASTRDLHLDTSFQAMRRGEDPTEGSDGLYVLTRSPGGGSRMTDDVLAASGISATPIMQRASARTIAGRLVAQSLLLGCTDDVTVLVVDLKKHI